MKRQFMTPSKEMPTEQIINVQLGNLIQVYKFDMVEHALIEGETANTQLELHLENLFLTYSKELVKFCFAFYFTVKMDQKVS